MHLKIPLSSRGLKVSDPKACFRVRAPPSFVKWIPPKASWHWASSDFRYVLFSASFPRINPGFTAKVNGKALRPPPFSRCYTRVYYLRPPVWEWAEGNNQLLKQDLEGRETASLTTNLGVDRHAGKFHPSRINKGTVSTPNFEDGGTFHTFWMFTPIKWPKAACGGSHRNL